MTTRTRQDQPIKCLLLTKQLEQAPRGGRELLCKLNHDALNLLYGHDLFLFEWPAGRLSGLIYFFNAFRGHIDGLDAVSIDAALKKIRDQEITKVFVDGSNLGGFVSVLKQRMPNVEITTFFHNVESRFFWGSLRLHKTLRALAVLVVNVLAERKAVKFSDKRICLSERDSRLLRRLFGKGATHIAPMVMEDKCPAYFFEQASIQPPERFALFVGGTFYANRAGIEWFVREVVPRIDLPVYIVGRGFESLRTELEVPGKVTVVGSVDSLADWYHRAQFVIAPIFDGSGMKTKVAEALMYGKKIVGTHEAFSGYEDVVKEAGWVCNSADEFVTAIAEAHTQITQTFNPTLRGFYEKYYSMTAAQERLREILA